MTAFAMGGWKTWVAAIATAALGILDVIDGNPETGVQKIVAAIALVGIGHKIEKSGGAS